MKALPYFVTHCRTTSARAGFTLLELLIVIGILAALAALLLSSLTGSREEMLDSTIVQKELSDIQRAVHRLAADCVLTESDHQTIAQYGLAVLMDDSIFTAWDSDRGKGWRGPYIEREGYREVDLSSIGQEPGVALIPVLQTPFSTSESDAHYYRVVATELVTVSGNEVERVIDSTGSVYQLWVIAPHGDGLPIAGELIEDFDRDFRRRLLLDRD